MPYISVSNVQVEEVTIEYDDGEFCIVQLLRTDARFMIRKNRVFNNKTWLERKLGIVKVNRTPADYFH